jgi:kynureninase
VYFKFLVDKNHINPNEDCIYLSGNSIGLMPKVTKKLMDEQFQKWADM